LAWHWFTFSFIEDRSDHTATDLSRSNSTFEVIFIDGNHRFDDVLVDFYLYAPLCATGGHIIFDDMWMRSIQTVVAFVRSNRPDFVEVPTPEANVCVFQKIGDDVRTWNNFHEFIFSRLVSRVYRWRKIFS
jgi:cephalosporin hydroxylase